MKCIYKYKYKDKCDIMKNVFGNFNNVLHNFQLVFGIHVIMDTSSFNSGSSPGAKFRCWHRAWLALRITVSFKWQDSSVNSCQCKYFQF